MSFFSLVPPPKPPQKEKKKEAKDVSLFFFLGFFWVGAVLEGGATAAQGIQLAFNDNRRTHRYILRI